MNPWEEKYNEMITAVGNNPVERKILTMLKNGYSISECMDSGLSHEEFSELLERAEAWETENLCVQHKDKK